MILIVALTVAIIGVITSVLLYVRLRISNRSQLDANLRNFSFQQIKNEEKNDVLEVERYWENSEEFRRKHRI